MATTGRSNRRLQTATRRGRSQLLHLVESASLAAEDSGKCVPALWPQAPAPRLRTSHASHGCPAVPRAGGHQPLPDPGSTSSHPLAVFKTAARTSLTCKDVPSRSRSGAYSPRPPEPERLADRTAATGRASSGRSPRQIAQTPLAGLDHRDGQVCSQTRAAEKPAKRARRTAGERSAGQREQGDGRRR